MYISEPIWYAYSLRCVCWSLKDSCSAAAFSAVQTPVGCLQPWSVPRGNGWGLGLELFKALGLCLQCPWWKHFKFYNWSNLTAWSQDFFRSFFFGFGLVVCTNDKSTESRRKEERYKPSVCEKDISRAPGKKIYITVDKIKRETSRRQTTIWIAARKKTLRYQNNYNKPWLY